MKKGLNNNYIIRSKDIHAINEATIVLRHFIGINAKLLPLLNEISSKKIKSETDLKNKDKILNVYKSFRFETETSEVLMNSDILNIIRSAYEEIEKHMNGISETKEVELLEELDNRYATMNREWVKTEMN